ncbi:MAG: YjjG family noncanonical pyrimidine nucleotidase [Bacteroidaceae bacterium]|nr:YjjG family noncanonical pyrimidine nucleotidase [Bacteroidaceae bacterium]
MTKYRNLFIDLDDTVYDFSAASRESFLETYVQLRYERFFDSFEHYMSIYEPYNLELWRIYGEGKITKEELNRRRYSHPLEVVGVQDQQLADTFCREALGRIPTKGNLVPGAIELLEYLRPKYRMYILSNGFKELQSRKMQTAGIDKYFDAVILSEDIGVNKPDCRLYEHALSTTSSKPGESLMIGDMFDTDIVGAANSGIDNIYFNPKGKTGHPFAPTYEVKKLLDIKEIL